MHKHEKRTPVGQYTEICVSEWDYLLIWLKGFVSLLGLINNTS